MTSSTGRVRLCWARVQSSWVKWSRTRMCWGCVQDVLIGLDDMIHQEGFELFKTVVLTTRPYTFLYVPILPYTSLYVPIRPYTSLYIPIHPYTSLYVPIRPYTSLYVLVVLQHEEHGITMNTSLWYSSMRNMVEPSTPPCDTPAWGTW